MGTHEAFDLGDLHHHKKGLCVARPQERDVSCFTLCSTKRASHPDPVSWERQEGEE